MKENSMFLVEALGSCPRPQAPPPGLGPASRTPPDPQDSAPRHAHLELRKHIYGAQ